MGNLARKIIDAIQHSLLGTLLVQLLWPCAWLFWVVLDELAPETTDSLPTLIILVLLPVGLFLFWLVGALANRRRAPGTPLEKLHVERANGFEAWQELPEGGLRPPRVMRWIVTVLGASPERKGSLPEFLLVMTSMGLAFTLAALGPDFWTRIHPELESLSLRRTLALSFATLFALLIIRNWATNQRRLLSR